MFTLEITLEICETHTKKVEIPFRANYRHFNAKSKLSFHLYRMHQASCAHYPDPVFQGWDQVSSSSSCAPLFSLRSRSGDTELGKAAGTGNNQSGGRRRKRISRKLTLTQEGDQDTGCQPNHEVKSFYINANKSLTLISACQGVL